MPALTKVGTQELILNTLFFKHTKCGFDYKNLLLNKPFVKKNK